MLQSVRELVAAAVLPAKFGESTSRFGSVGGIVSQMFAIIINKLLCSQMMFKRFICCVFCEVDLFHFFAVAQKLGGYDKVTLLLQFILLL